MYIYTYVFVCLHFYLFLYVCLCLFYVLLHFYVIVRIFVPICLILCYCLRIYTLKSYKLYYLNESSYICSKIESIPKVDLSLVYPITPFFCRQIISSCLISFRLFLLSLIFEY